MTLVKIYCTYQIEFFIINFDLPVKNEHYRSISKFQYWTAFKSEVEKYQRKPISVVSDLKCGKMKIESIRILPPVCLKIKTNSNAQKYYRRLALFETSQIYHIGDT